MMMTKELTHEIPTVIDKLLTCEATKSAIGCGTTKLYELIASGRLDARKLGRHTRITESSVKSFLASLPRAVITTGRKVAA